jgi:hypothetical protein
MDGLHIGAFDLSVTWALLIRIGRRIRTEQQFSGTFYEVKRKLEDWKAANPTCRILKEGPAGAMGDAVMLDAPVWILTIEFANPDSN